MKYRPKIIHIAQTPLVAAPLKVSRMLTSKGIDSVCFYESDYPARLANRFITGSFKYPNDDASINQICDEYIKGAEIIHIHNHLTPATIKRIAGLAPNAKFVYELHSAPKEGPLYMPRESEFPFVFDAKLVVAQHQARFYHDFTMVPNIIDSSPTVNLIGDGEKLRMLFSPTHPRGGRWGQKTSEAFEKKISALAATGMIDFIMLKEAVSPEQLLQIRRSTHITIDEVMTGGYHQVSLEGMCAGNVVINNADYFAKSALSSTVGAKELPPYLNANEDNIVDVLMDLARNPEKVRGLQTASHEYFKNYLMPDKVIEIYMQVYRKVMNG